MNHPNETSKAKLLEYAGPQAMFNVGNRPGLIVKRLKAGVLEEDGKIVHPVTKSWTDADGNSIKGV